MMARLPTLLSLLAAASLALSAVLPALLSPSHDDDTPLPLIIWHGLGDNYQADGISAVARLAESINPGTFVYIIRLDADPSADRSASFFGNLTVQVEQVCAALAAHPILSTAPAVDALGFSQGGQFLRAYVERCNAPPVRSLVTLGSQHNGIAEFQACAPSDWMCRGWESVLRSNTWGALAQNRLVPAQYFRDPEQYEEYLEHSNFLADVNNERVSKNATYRENLERLEKFVMYIFEDDTTVVPKESGWFAEVNGTEVTLLKDMPIYKEDWLGLQALDRKGALEFKSTPGGHMNLPQTLLEDIFKDYYGPYRRSFEKVQTERPWQEEL
jgi:palmitoyl-protein thioesterase